MAGSSRTPNIDIPLTFENYEDDEIQIGISPPTIQSTTQPTTETSTKQGGASWVWQFAIRDREQGVAICKLCKKDFKMKSGGGTGTIARHLENKHGPEIGKDKGQTQIHTVGGQVVGNFKYSKEQDKRGLARYIVRAEKPFTTSECDYLEEYIQTCLQPQFGKVSRRSIKREIVKYYEEMRDFLTATFASTNNKFALTCDSWRASYNINFICVTTHWIDNEWHLQKRIIAFQQFPAPHTGQNIANTMVSIANAFGINDRIFSVSFDNASNNTSAIPHLIRQFKPVLDGAFFHNRCACHILNLCVQDGLQFINDIVSPIRDFIIFIRQSPAREEQWKSFCKTVGKKPRRFPLDSPHRWNSTFRMLQSTSGYEVLIHDFYTSFIFPLNNVFLEFNSFETANNVLDVLSAMELATTKLSASYFPTAHILLPTIVQIAHQMHQYINQASLNAMILAMQENFLKYYENIPFIYCVACALDPTVKFYGLEIMLRHYDACTPGWISIDFVAIRDKTIEILNDLYRIYEQNNNSFGGNDTQDDNFPSTSLTTIKGKNVLDTYSLFDFQKRQRTSYESEFNEVALFGKSRLECRNPNEEYFDVLKWWRENERTYPTLAAIARDILMVPVSTVASESAFSAGGRVLDEKRQSMHPTTLEMTVLLKDWCDAEKRKQGLMEELEDSTSSSNEDKS